MNTHKAIRTLLLLVCLPFVLTGVETLQAPPKPAKLSNKERSALIAIYESLAESSTPLQVGSTEEELITRMGPPEGTMTIGSRKRLSYGGGSAIIENGKVTTINDIPEELLSTPNREAFEDYQNALGKIFYMGEWMTEEDAQNKYEKALQDKKLTQERIRSGQSAKAVREKRIAISKTSYYDFKRNGAAIQLSELLAPDKVTIVDFYADWCAPCKAIDPYLRGLANDPKVAVRKVDIVKWGSPVARQWSLNSIPNMRVYDRHGKQVGEPTHDIRQLYNYVRRAKRQ